MEDGIRVFYPDGHSEIGKIYIFPTEIVVYKKSMAIRLAFGLVGSFFDNGNESLRFNICDIINAQQAQFRLKKTLIILH